MLKATKIRIYPNKEQEDFLNCQFGAIRFVYNKSLHIMSHRYKTHGESLNAKHDIKPLLAVAKKSRKYFWLKDFDSIALQQSCINLDKAFKQFFDKKQKSGYPRFKRKFARQTSYHCVGVNLLDGAIKIPKINPIKARIHRNIEGKVKSITIEKKNTGKYFASILTEDGENLPEPLRHIDDVVGIDMGLTHIAIDSEGNKTNNPRFLKSAYRNLRRKQKALSRCKKGSGGRAKARKKLAKAHERVANARSDFQHKLSRQIIDENQAVSVETLKVKNMLKNRKLAKHISDAGWSEFIRKLEYKAMSSGKHLVKIDQWFASSKTCSHCNHKVEVLPLSVRNWDCPSCGTTGIDRDINAAVNIRNQGIIKLKADGLTVSANGGLCNSRRVRVAALEVGSFA